MLEHHSLFKDFPQHHEAVHRLKTQNHHFRNLFDQYDALDKEIYNIEANGSMMKDNDLNFLKTKRVKLKDELLHAVETNE